MKLSRLLAAVLLSILMLQGFSQMVNDSASNQRSYNYYRARAKRQTTSALVLFFSGLTLATISFSQVKFLGDTPPEVTVGLLSGLGLELGGVAFAFATAGSRSKAKKFKTAIKMESQHSFANGSVSKIYYPSVGIRFHF